MKEFESTTLNKIGFKGSLPFIHAEEGSGAKAYKCSLYYPDSRTNPKTESGVTIDPGLDLGHADRKVIDDTLKYYLSQGVISPAQVSLLKTAIGKKKLSAVDWIKTNEKHFKNSFMVKDNLAIIIMDSVTAPPYWKPLIESMPGLLKIKSLNVAAAVHTALLSMSYNRGYRKTIALADDFILKADYEGLAAAISSVKSSTTSLRNRRIRESNLITAALENEDNSRIMPAADLNPEPLPADIIQRTNFIDRIIELTDSMPRPTVNL